MNIRLGKNTTRVISRIHKINGWENRAIYGAAALCVQPFFDSKNPNVDETTRKYSVRKTLIKILVGASVGILSRAGFQRWGENLFEKGSFDVKSLGIKNLDKPKMKRSVGNVFAIIGAVSAMFSVDILISHKLLNHFNKKLQGSSIKEAEDEKAS